MIIDNSTMYIKDVIYSNKFLLPNINDSDKYDLFSDDYQIINNTINIDNTFQTIENMFVIDALDACYSHMLLDHIAHHYTALNQIKEINDINNLTIFFRKCTFDKYPQHWNPVKNNEYMGVYKKLLVLLEYKNYIFENHVKNNNFLIKNCYFSRLDLKGQYSVWNTNEHYPGRICLPKDIQCSDEKIYLHLNKFVNSAFKKYNINRPNFLSYNSAIIIERKYNRNFLMSKLNDLIETISKTSIVFNGIKILEDMTFEEQLLLFSTNNIFLFRHGSCLANLLWIPQNSLIFDIDDFKGRPNIVKRVALLTKSAVHSIDYDNIDYNIIKNTLNNWENTSNIIPLKTTSNMENIIQSKNITLQQYNEIINQNKHHFDTLLDIVNKYGNKMTDSNYFYHNGRLIRIVENINKQINLFVLGSLSNNILKVGFDDGYHALLLLLSNKDSKICCFDICKHSYTKKCFEYLSQQFPSRIELYEGNSNDTLLEYYNNNNTKKFDLIYINGCHNIDVANIDYFHTKMMVVKNTIVVFDNANYQDLQTLWNGYIRDNHMKEIIINKITKNKHSIGICL